MNVFDNRLRGLCSAIALSAAVLASGTALADRNKIDVSEEVMQAALREGRVTIYTTLAAAVMEEKIAQFRAAVPGIEVDMLRLATGPLQNRYAQEVSVNVHTPDIVNFASIRTFEEQPELFIQLTAEDLPLLAQWPQSAIKGHYLNQQQGIQVIAYNNALVTGDDIPKTWDDVLKPVFKDKGMLVDPRASSTYMSWLYLMEETYGPEFTTALRAQNFTLVEGGTQGVQQVSAGGHLVVVPPPFSHAKPYMEQGAPIGVSLPQQHSDVPAHGPQHSWGIPVNAPNPNAAKVFFAWFLTEDAQKVNCSMSGAASVFLTDYDGCPPPSDAYVPAEQEISAERRAQMMERLGLN